MNLADRFQLLLLDQRLQETATVTQMCTSSLRVIVIVKPHLGQLVAGKKRSIVQVVSGVQQQLSAASSCE